MTYSFKEITFASVGLVNVEVHIHFMLLYFSLH